MRAPIDPALLHFRTEIRPEAQPDGSLVYMAECPDLPGCMSHGSTVDEARQNLEDAKNEYVAALIERGLPIPGPESAPAVGTITWTVISPSEVAIGEQGKIGWPGTVDWEKTSA